MAITSTKEQNLQMQGFSYSSISQRELEKWLRFTPTLSAICIFMGTVLAVPLILWLFSIVALLGAMSEHHPFDFIYNNWIRLYTKTAPLPVNPRPRRFAMLIAGIWSAVTAVLFFVDFRTAGYISGLVLASAAILVATTHFCVGSWIFRMLEHQKMKGAG